MKDSQLEKLTFKELKELQQRVAVAIEARQDREKQELKEKMAQLAAEAGFSLGDLVGQRRGPKGKAAGVKYRHPDDPNLTWSGRGRKPNWLAKANGNIERFRVA